MLQNLFDGNKKLRLLDIKVGTWTADANWKGKSSFAAFRNNTVDKLTNSSIEGYRLEGFDGMPENLKSKNPTEESGLKGKEKKHKRMQLQSMPAYNWLSYFLDIREAAVSFDRTTTASPSEYAEAILCTLIKRMTALVQAFQSIPAPQKWIGSSIAFGFDCGLLPPRSELDSISERSACYIFDWGRSELLSKEEFEALSGDDKEDRVAFWKYYTTGAKRLLFELCRAYYQRYTTSKWETVCIEILDYDAVSSDDPIGYTMIPLQETSGTFPIMQPDGKKQLKSKGEECSIKVNITKTQYPADSKLASGWEIEVIGVNRIPNMDWSKNLLSFSKNKSDAFVSISVLSSTSADRKSKVGKKPVMRSRVIMDDNHPQWCEKFEFAEVKNPSEMLELLSIAGLSTVVTLEQLDGWCLNEEASDDEALAQSVAFLQYFGIN
mmetsp:Transcript_2008/g.3207  ORF Transcript_2008/g.3207 Transcript_2008/m.3207 type:complete len:436 (+) Transcript_2008:309-1616(+)